MGVRTRGLDIAINAKRQVADAAARAEAKAVVERWNDQLAASRDMLWSPTIRAALIAGTPWLDVFCPGCGTSRAIDLRTVDRHPYDKFPLSPRALNHLLVNSSDRKGSEHSGECGDDCKTSGNRREACRPP